YLFDAILKMRFKSFTQGAAQDNLSQEKLLSIKFPVPEVSVQKRIADILSTYDHLIENNERRIAQIEEAARLLYREWFVHFRFPGHEHVKIMNQTPTGWSSVRMEDICCFLGRGISPTYDDDGGSIVVNQKCIRNRMLSMQQARRQTKE